jgi:hypothetical protein
MIQSIQPGAAMVWEVIEPEENREPRPNDNYATKRFDQLPQRYFDFGGCYATIGFNPWDAIFALKECHDVYENLSAHLGYRIRPGIIWRRKVKDQPEEIVLGLINDGCASAPGVFQITSQFGDRETASIDLSPGFPIPGERMSLVPIKIPEALQDTEERITVKLSIALKMKNKVRPVKWNVEDSGMPGTEILEFPLYKKNYRWTDSHWVVK